VVEEDILLKLQDRVVLAEEAVLMGLLLVVDLRDMLAVLVLVLQL
jgi:hypothetical protein